MSAESLAAIKKHMRSGTAVMQPTGNCLEPHLAVKFIFDNFLILIGALFFTLPKTSCFSAKFTVFDRWVFPQKNSLLQLRKKEVDSEFVSWNAKTFQSAYETKKVKLTKRTSWKVRFNWKSLNFFPVCGISFISVSNLFQQQKPNCL